MIYHLWLKKKKGPSTSILIQGQRENQAQQDSVMTQRSHCIITSHKSSLPHVTVTHQHHVYQRGSWGEVKLVQLIKTPTLGFRPDHDLRVVGGAQCRALHSAGSMLEDSLSLSLFQAPHQLKEKKKKTMSTRNSPMILSLSLFLSISPCPAYLKKKKKKTMSTKNSPRYLVF